MAAVKMLLSSIRIDGGTQPRAEIDVEAVADYALALQMGAKLPPVVVFEDGADFWLADGFHRYHAHRKLENDSIEAEIHPGTRRDAVLYSVGANVEHGLRRSNADKRKAVTTLLNDDEWRAWSDREIATACHVTPRFVDAIRSSLRMVRSDEPPKSPDIAAEVAEKAERIRAAGGEPRYYKDKHGNTSVMDVSKINARRAAKAAQKKKEEEEERKQREKDIALTADEQTKEFEKVLAENRQLIAQVKALETDDTTAALAKEPRLRQQAEDEKGRLMNRLNVADKALRKFGKYFDDLRKITGATTNAGVVEAVRVAFQQAA